MIEDYGKMVEFPWGEVIQVYHICNEYTIVEYHPRKTKGCIVTNQINTEEKRYQGYIKNTNTNTSWDSLDAALVGCIAYKYEGQNHHADAYFIRMIQGGNK